MKKIFIYLADGFEEIEAITPMDVLRRAGYEVTTISVMGRKEVKGAHGVPVIADKLFTEADHSAADMIVLPGGMPGAKNLDSHEGLKSQILRFNEQGKPVSAICAAPMVLGHLGVLKGKTVTCYPGFEDHLTGAKVTGKAVEVDGHFTTGRGPGAAMKFALAIVERFSGKNAVLELTKQMVVE